MSTTPVPSIDVVALITATGQGVKDAYAPIWPVVIGVAGGLLALRLSWAVFLSLSAESRSNARVDSMFKRAAETEAAGAYGQARSQLRAAQRAERAHDRKWS